MHHQGIKKAPVALASRASWPTCLTTKRVAFVAAFGFPESRAAGTVTQRLGGKLPGAIWLASIGVSCIALVQAMIFAFLERIRADRASAARRGREC